MFPQMRAFNQSSEYLVASVEVDHLFTCSFNSCHEEVCIELKWIWMGWLLHVPFEDFNCTTTTSSMLTVSGALVTQSDMQLSRSWCSHREDEEVCLRLSKELYVWVAGQACIFDSHLRLASLDFRTARFARPAFASSCTQVLRIRSRLILHLFPENC